MRQYSFTWLDYFIKKGGFVFSLHYTQTVKPINLIVQHFKIHFFDRNQRMYHASRRNGRDPFMNSMHWFVQPVLRYYIVGCEFIQSAWLLDTSTAVQFRVNAKCFYIFIVFATVRNSYADSKNFVCISDLVA